MFITEEESKGSCIYIRRVGSVEMDNKQCEQFNRPNKEIELVVYSFLFVFHSYM